jgi:hypothetical protein
LPILGILSKTTLMRCVHLDTTFPDLGSVLWRPATRSAFTYAIARLWSHHFVLLRCLRVAAQGFHVQPKPLLTEEHKQARMQFCTNHQHTAWATWYWSDEFTIYPNGKRGKRIVRAVLFSLVSTHAQA